MTVSHLSYILYSSAYSTGKTRGEKFAIFARKWRKVLNEMYKKAEICE